MSGIDSVTRARVIELAEAGMSQAAIAREVGIARSSVGRICADAGITFDRSKTAAAVEAHRIDLKAERTALAGETAQRARAILDKLDRPHVVVGWYQGEAFEHELAGPTSGDARNLAIAAAVLVDKHLALVKHDADDRDLPAVDRWLAQMLGETP
ncbi:helix-turn-helix domain-containing protein [Microbacterium sp. GXF7504]